MSNSGTITKHPDYIASLPDWEQMQDCYAGERQVKFRERRYLPRPSGLKNTPEGNAAFRAYIARAIYFEYIADTVKAMLGVMFAENLETRELPKRLEKMADSITPNGENLDSLMMSICKAQLIEGRCGLLLELPDSAEGAEVIPFILQYPCQKIINWDSKVVNGKSRLKFVVLDESGLVFNPLKKTWDKEIKYRICGLKNNEYYSVGVTDKEYSAFDFSNPALKDDAFPVFAGKKLDFIPFTFVNTSHCNLDCEKPPLMALANISLGLYRGEADYRQALFLQGQDTLFLKGFRQTDSVVIGAGQSLQSESTESDAKFIGVSGQGLPEMRQSQQSLHEQAQALGVALVDNSSAESGNALGKRLATKTASMKMILMTCAAAITQQLQYAAKWSNSNPDEVKIVPNTDFASASVTAADLVQIWSSKLQGAPLSARSFHTWMRRNAFTDLTFEEEQEELATERALQPEQDQLPQ